jgi:nucleoid-associated protein YgaU
MGGNTRANREAIIDANPSLQDDPDRVIVGKTYAIPTKDGNNDGNLTASNNSSRSNLTSTASGAYFYTVKEGDSLWQIANNQLEDPSAVDAIKELNTTVLKGEQHDVVIPGMKLRLPAKPVADTNN